MAMGVLPHQEDPPRRTRPGGPATGGPGTLPFACAIHKETPPRAGSTVVMRSTLHIQSPSYSHKRLPNGRAFHHRLGIPIIGKHSTPIRIAYAIKGSITFIRAFFHDRRLSRGVPIRSRDLFRIARMIGSRTQPTLPLSMPSAAVPLRSRARYDDGRGAVPRSSSGRWSECLTDMINLRGIERA